VVDPKGRKSGETAPLQPVDDLTQALSIPHHVCEEVGDREGYGADAPIRGNEPQALDLAIEE